MELADEARDEHAEPVNLDQLILLAASPDELSAHEAVLDSIAKETRGTPVWRAGQG
jgi:hypothetical protein